MAQYTVYLQIVVETNDQPNADVRARLSAARNRVGHRIKEAARAAAVEAIRVSWPESYFPNWPESGKGAEVVAVRQHTRRSD